MAKTTLRGKTFMQAFRRRCKTALIKLGEQEANALRVDLSIPVQKTSLGMIRSQPGEAPRKERGKLMHSVESMVSVDAGGVTVRVQAGGPEAPYAGTLEHGGFANFGSISPRPFMYPSHERMKRRATSQLVSLLRGKAS